MFTLRLLGSASLEGPDGPVVGRAALRQRIALLALLAVEHPRPLSRDKLVANLWPESATGDARHLLRESLYILRSALGEESVVSGGDDLRLSSDRLSCDLWEFEAALGRGDLEAAVGVYHGPFLSDDEERAVVHLGDEVPQRYADGTCEAYGLALTPHGGKVGIGAGQPVDIAARRRFGDVEGRETGGQIDQPFDTFEHALPPFVQRQWRHAF